MTESLEAVQVRVRGVVQGVGFRPSVFRLARDHALTGWVLNAENGVEIHLEGPELALDAFLRDLKTHPPPAAAIDSLDVEPATFEGFRDFTIRESTRVTKPTVRVSPDLCVCVDCLGELFDPGDARAGYPYINCTNCGPRYSIVEGLPVRPGADDDEGLGTLCRVRVAISRRQRSAIPRAAHRLPDVRPAVLASRRRWEVRGSR